MFSLLGKTGNPEPKIVTLNEPHKVIGLSIRTGMNSVYADVPRVLQQLSDLDEKIKIPNKKQPWEYISLSNNFAEDKTWDYYTGYAVTKSESIPKEFVFLKRLPGIMQCSRCGASRSTCWDSSSAKQKNIYTPSGFRNQNMNLGDMNLNIPMKRCLTKIPILLIYTWQLKKRKNCSYLTMCSI